MNPLDKFPKANPEPKIPDTLLEEPASLPMGTESEFSQLEGRELLRMPKYAACKVSHEKCTLIFTKAQKSISGNLAGELPEGEWEKNTKEILTPFLRAAATLLLAQKVAVPLLAGIAAILAGLWIGLLQNESKKEFIEMAASITGIGMVTLIGMCILTYIRIGKEVENPKLLECRRPPLGPETKKRIAGHLKTGWEDVHLLWPAEKNWKEPFLGEPTFHETHLLVIGEKGYDYIVADKIENRLL